MLKQLGPISLKMVCAPILLHSKNCAFEGDDSVSFWTVYSYCTYSENPQNHGNERRSVIVMQQQTISGFPENEEHEKTHRREQKREQRNQSTGKVWSHNKQRNSTHPWKPILGLSLLPLAASHSRTSFIERLVPVVSVNWWSTIAQCQHKRWNGIDCPSWIRDVPDWWKVWVCHSA